MVRVRYSSELYHHGIKGQKWGIRRYQNKDGTLTPEGKLRYGGVTKVQYTISKSNMKDPETRAQLERFMPIVYNEGDVEYLSDIVKQGGKLHLSIGKRPDIEKLKKMYGKNTYEYGWEGTGKNNTWISVTTPTNTPEWKSYNRYMFGTKGGADLDDDEYERLMYKLDSRDPGFKSGYFDKYVNMDKVRTARSKNKKASKIKAAAALGVWAAGSALGFYAAKKFDGRLAEMDRERRNEELNELRRNYRNDRQHP